MTLSDLFQMLAAGELSNLAMAEEGGGSIVYTSRPKIVLYANDVLLRLYSRFPILEKDVLVQMHEHITFYHLRPRFAVNYVPSGPSNNESIRYLLDSPGDPFVDDIIKILSVFDSSHVYEERGVGNQQPFTDSLSNAGYIYQHRWMSLANNKLPLNDDEQPFSVFTPQPHILQVPHPIPHGLACQDRQRALSVLYQAKHPKLNGELGQEIHLPDILVGALTAYIAYKVFSHMNTQDSTSKAQEHLAIYKGICGDVVENDLVSVSISTTSAKFHKSGWI